MDDFGTLVYTDCRPGQGLSGGAGLQFQAASPDVDGDAMALVQRHLLYEPPSGWMREQRPVEDYPPSFAHVGGEQLATAAGVYLGREANGTREGNQLTHAIATRDPQAYGLLRPAQLYGASFWTTKPAATTQCEPVPADPPPGILDTETVHEFVRNHPHGRPLLAALLTVLSLPDDGTNPQVLFIADQTEPVLTWVAAATLLMPHRQAVQIGFKVFTTSPTRSSQRVLAVHPAWEAPPASVDHPSGYLVVDLLAGRWSDVEAASLAGRWAELFCDGDPFDVSDAVELAAGSGLRPDEAMSLARVAVLGGAPEAPHAEAVVGWLTEGPAELVSAYGAPVAEAFTTDVANQPLGLLRKLDRATRGGGFDGQAVPVRMALLGAELRAVAGGGSAPREPVPPVTEREWGPEETDRALRLTLGALRSARGEGFAGMLSVAGCFRIPLGYADIGAAADGFVADWARHPAVRYHPGGWPGGAEFVDQLRDHLNDQIRRRVLDARAVGDAWYARLAARDALAPLDAALIGAKMAATDDDGGRNAIVTDQLARATAAPDPRHQVTALGRCLWRWTVPRPDELRVFARAMPAGAEVDPDAVDAYLAAQIQSLALVAEDLDLLQLMKTNALLRPTPATRELLRSHQVLRSICTRLPAVEKHDPQLVESMRDIDRNVVRVHRMALIDALLKTAVPGTVAAVLDLHSVDLQRFYARKVALELKEKPAASTVATAMVVACRTRDRQTADELLTAVNKWASWAGSGAVDKVSAVLDVPGFTSAHARWLELLDTNRVRRGRSWLRGSKGR
ncbi:MAG TPA: GTPase-associated protein 1-related protein [Actinoplanes sp.]|nr:GTPase-associated protein 1-related protein [Actinoplanes sp.]